MELLTRTSRGVVFNKATSLCTIIYLAPKYVLEDVLYSASNVSHLSTVGWKFAQENFPMYNYLLSLQSFVYLLIFFLHDGHYNAKNFSHPPTIDDRIERRLFSRTRVLANTNNSLTVVLERACTNSWAQSKSQIEADNKLKIVCSGHLFCDS